MYRCLNCRHMFTDFLAVKTEKGKIGGCPWCGSTSSSIFVEVCDGCHRYFPERYIYGHFCRGCLREQIDYATGLRYLLAREFLRPFMESVGGPLPPRTRTPDILQAFLRLQTDDQKRAKPTFLNKLRDYITADRICAKDFGEWLEGRDPS